MATEKIIAYAVRTNLGYLAEQGKYTWVENKPVGWALFSDREGAENLAMVANRSGDFSVVEVVDIVEIVR